jgi:glycosyltransferase involved in cell wall biosynthesis
MNIVHISTYDNGGAGNAALRLHLGLLEIGINSTFLCAVKSTNFNNIVEFSQKKHFLKSTFLRTPFNAVGFPIDKPNQNLKALEQLEGKYEVFTFPDSDADVLSHPAVRTATIINLHWVAKYLDYQSFFSAVDKPVFWTLHDMNPFQGGFHYHNDVERNKIIFGFLEYKLRKKKESLIQLCKNLKVISPSKWMHTQAKNSEAFKLASHFHIPYGLNTETFKDFGKEISRAVFDLPLNKIIISFITSDINNPRKGFDLLCNAVKNIENKQDVLFCVIGSASIELIDGDFINLGYITDERLMALVYSASDGFVLPSREDNLPNVLLEAMSCGTPVLSFSVGGMLDMINPGFNGELSTEISSESLTKSLNIFIRNISYYNRKAIRSNIVENYNLKVQASNYLELYRNII